MKSLSYYYKAIKVNNIYLYHKIFHKVIYKKLSRYVKVLTPEQTVNEINENNLSVTRFGDGEFELIFGNSLRFQKHSKEIAQRLTEVLSSKNQNLFVCVNRVMFGKLKGSKTITLAYRRMIVENFSFFKKHFDLTRMYGEASFTRFYIDNPNKHNKNKILKYVEKLKEIWDNKDVLIVEGELSRLGVANDLFDNTNSIERILCPVIDAFESYNEILNSIKQSSGKNKLVLLALGPTATILAYDLSTMGIRAIDVGHIDVEYMWFKLGVKKRVLLKGKFVNEVLGEHFVDDLSDEEKLEYKQQIIKIIN